MEQLEDIQLDPLHHSMESRLLLLQLEARSRSLSLSLINQRRESSYYTRNKFSTFFSFVVVV